MNWKLAVQFTALFSVCIIVYLLSKLCRVNNQLSTIKDALCDIKKGNLNRRILTRNNDITKTICYDINEIIVNSQVQLVRMKQSEQAYKRLMTSLSHDVKTPLASLVGYLEAVHKKIVTGEEKEEYIHIALDKAYCLNDFVKSLFEWVKLDSGEQVYQFQLCDLNELSRNIIADWIPVLEDKQFTYEIDIPDTECNMRLDRNAYMRILNNLIHNAFLHSGGDIISLHIFEAENQAKIIVSDNGKGITEKDLPHIFKWQYQGDESRRIRGNGLGLSIVQELVNAHGGTIYAKSPSHGGTEFTIILPKAL